MPDSIQFKLTAAKSKMIEKSIERVDMNPDTRAKILKDVFLADIEKLEELINRDLSSWKNSKLETKQELS